MALLIARGLTNRQIAEALVIAEGTAAVHVNHILGKLECSSRAQVAAWAGHSVEMLRRVYAGRAEGLDDLWITRMTHTLPQDQP